MFRLHVFLILWAYISADTSQKHFPDNNYPLLLILSLDGFRYDYYGEFRTPNLYKMASEGVYASYVNNVFVTKTFPNHFSIATGLYAESHGIVDNMFFDPKLNKTFTYYQNTEPEFWDKGGVPIWVLNQEQNAAKLYSGGIMWPGTDAIIHNMTSFHLEIYNETIPFPARIDTTISYFLNSTHPANVVFLYFDEPDNTGHRYGPNSKQIKTKVKEVDEAVGYLVSALKKAGLYDRINLIITGDHGMEETNYSRIIELKDLISSELYTIVPGSLGPVLGIWPKYNKSEEVFDRLKNISEIVQGFDVYRRGEIPLEWHYNNNDRIPPVLVVSWPGYYVVQENPHDTNPVFGVHGYNNSLPSMHPLFIARGPRFKSNYQTEAVNMLDLYPLMCDILELTPGPHNGSLENIRHILRVSKGINSVLLTVVMILLTLSVICGGMLLVLANRRDQEEEEERGSGDEVQTLL